MAQIEFPKVSPVVNLLKSAKKAKAAARDLKAKITVQERHFVNTIVLQDRFYQRTEEAVITLGKYLDLENLCKHAAVATAQALCRQEDVKAESGPPKDEDAEDDEDGEPLVDPAAFDCAQACNQFGTECVRMCWEYCEGDKAELIRLQEEKDKLEYNLKAGHRAYLQEVTMLRDRLRHPNPITFEEDERYFYEPIQYFDKELQELVKEICIEKVKMELARFGGGQHFVEEIERLNALIEQLKKDYEEKIRDLESAMELAKAQRVELEKMVEEQKKNVEKIKKDLQGKDKEIEQLNMMISELRNEISRLKRALEGASHVPEPVAIEEKADPALGLAQSKLKSMEEEIKQLKLRILELERELAKKPQTVTEKVKEKAPVVVETVPSGPSDEEMDQLRRNHEAQLAELRRQLGEAKQEIERLLEALANQKPGDDSALLDQLRRKLEDAERRAKEWEVRALAAEAALAKAKLKPAPEAGPDLEEWERRIRAEYEEKLRLQQEKYEEIIRGLKKEIKELKAEIKELKEEIKELKATLEQLKAKLQELQELMHKQGLGDLCDELMANLGLGEFMIGKALGNIFDRLYADAQERRFRARQRAAHFMFSSDDNWLKRMLMSGAMSVQQLLMKEEHGLLHSGLCCAYGHPIQLPDTSQPAMPLDNLAFYPQDSIPLHLGEDRTPQLGGQSPSADGGRSLPPPSPVAGGSQPNEPGTSPSPTESPAQSGQALSRYMMPPANSIGGDLPAVQEQQQQEGFASGYKPKMMRTAAPKPPPTPPKPKQRNRSRSPNESSGDEMSDPERCAYPAAARMAQRLAGKVQAVNAFGSVVGKGSDPGEKSRDASPQSHMAPVSESHGGSTASRASPQPAANVRSASGVTPSGDSGGGQQTIPEPVVGDFSDVQEANAFWAGNPMADLGPRRAQPSSIRGVQLVPPDGRSKQVRQQSAPVAGESPSSGYHSTSRRVLAVSGSPPPGTDASPRTGKSRSPSPGSARGYTVSRLDPSYNASEMSGWERGEILPEASATSPKAWRPCQVNERESPQASSNAPIWLRRGGPADSFVSKAEFAQSDMCVDTRLRAGSAPSKDTTASPARRLARDRQGLGQSGKKFGGTGPLQKLPEAAVAGRRHSRDGMVKSRSLPTLQKAGIEGPSPSRGRAAKSRPAPRDSPRRSPSPRSGLPPVDSSFGGRTILRTADDVADMHVQYPASPGSYGEGLSCVGTANRGAQESASLRMAVSPANRLEQLRKLEQYPRLPRKGGPFSALCEGFSDQL